jgi:hypothetical protein
MGVVRVFLFYFDIFCLVQDRERAATSACHCNQPDAETGLFYSSVCLFFLPFTRSILLRFRCRPPFRIDNDDERPIFFYGSCLCLSLSLCVYRAE